MITTVKNSPQNHITSITSITSHHILMSTGGPNTQRFSPFTAPLRGSFPLDREHLCDSMVSAYLKCLKEYNNRRNCSEKNKMSTDNLISTTTITTTNTNTIPTLPLDNDNSSSSGELCRPLAKLYLECRMKAGLMTAEDLNELGY